MDQKPVDGVSSQLDENLQREIDFRKDRAAYKEIKDITVTKALQRYREEAFINATGAEQQQFDAVMSRVPLLSEGRQGQILAEITDVESVARSFAAVLEQVEPTIRSIDQADALSLRLLQARLASL